MSGLMAKIKSRWGGGQDQTGRLSKPKEILQAVGQALVLNHRQDPDWVWNLMCVTRTIDAAGQRLEYRVYNPQTASNRGVHVKDFNTLETHPELILYSGWIDKKTREMELLSSNQRPAKAS